MNLPDTIALNQKLLALIETKYLDPPYLWPRGPDRTYYNHVLKDTTQAQIVLKRTGIQHSAPPP